MQKRTSKRLVQSTALAGFLLSIGLAVAQEPPAGNAAHGKAYFQISCATCHSPELGQDNIVINKQGPNLVGVVGRPAGSVPNFNYTTAMHDSGFTWNAAS